MRKYLENRDLIELLFRLLFCLIFIGLGGEHLINDQLIQKLMPAWVPSPRLVSILCGLWLSFWGSFLILGWRLEWAAYGLGAFIIIVTLVVHGPGLIFAPAEMPTECGWMWDILQRTNFVKNLCLLGVCFHLTVHQTGKYSLNYYLEQRKAAPPTNMS